MVISCFKCFKLLLYFSFRFFPEPQLLSEFFSHHFSRNSQFLLLLKVCCQLIQFFILSLSCLLVFFCLLLDLDYELIDLLPILSSLFFKIMALILKYQFLTLQAVNFVLVLRQSILKVIDRLLLLDLRLIILLSLGDDLQL